MVWIVVMSSVTVNNCKYKSNNKYIQLLCTVVYNLQYTLQCSIQYKIASRVDASGYNYRYGRR